MHIPSQGCLLQAYSSILYSSQRTPCLAMCLLQANWSFSALPSSLDHLMGWPGSAMDSPPHLHSALSAGCGQLIFVISFSEDLTLPGETCPAHPSPPERLFNTNIYLWPPSHPCVSCWPECSSLPLGDWLIPNSWTTHLPSRQGTVLFPKLSAGGSLEKPRDLSGLRHKF